MSSGDTSSSINPYGNDYASIIAWNNASVAISIVLTTVRFYVRWHLVKKVGWDDWLLLAGVACFSASCITDNYSFIAVRDQGFAKGDAFGLLLASVSTTLYAAQAIFVRAAYTVFYLKVIPPELGLRWHRSLIIAALTVYSAYITANGLFVNIFQCGSPANLNNLPVVPATACLSSNTLEILYNVAYCCDIFFDWILALTAMDVVRRTVHSTKVKMSILPVLAMGCVASIIAVIIPPLKKFGGPQPQGQEDLRKVIVMNILEVCEALLAIICFCLVALKPLFQTYIRPMMIKTLTQTETITLPTLPSWPSVSTPIGPSYQDGAPNGNGTLPSTRLRPELAATLEPDPKQSVRLDSAVMERSLDNQE